MFLCLSIKRPVALRLVPIQTETKGSLDAGAIGEPRARTCRLARSTPLIGAVVDFHFVISTKCSRQELLPEEPTSTLDLNVKALDTSIKNDEVNAKPEAQHQHYRPDQIPLRGWQVATCTSREMSGNRRSPLAPQAQPSTRTGMTGTPFESASTTSIMHQGDWKM